MKEQKVLGSVDIEKIAIDLRSRDEMPKILLGLQYIYCNTEVREAVFKILEEMVPEGKDKNNGRPGMELWKILVLGSVRLGNNFDFDKLQDIANNHITVREMLGHGFLDKEYYYPIQTLKDNLSLFTPEILDRINQIVVKAGHRLIYRKKNEEIQLNGRCDSFVVKTDVHYPTDINLLFDAMRKVITLISRLCKKVGINGWRKSNYNLKTVKRLFRKIQNLKHSKSDKEEKKTQREEEIQQAYMDYISVVEYFLDRTAESLSEIEKMKSNGSANGCDIGVFNIIQSLEIGRFVDHAYRQIDQIRRRVIYGEVIPHVEKLFSIFEEYTEWISKGKAGVPQELGLKVCIIEDQNRFILHHRVMEKESDVVVGLPMVQETQKRYNNFTGCSFDKGFHSQENKIELSKILDRLILPGKGRITQTEREQSESKEYIKGRQKHSGVESAINALENHGLDRCLDHGIVGFKRYVGLAVLSRNIHILGNIIHQKKVKALEKLKKLKEKKGCKCLNAA